MQRLQLCHHKPRSAWGYQKLEEEKKDPLLEAWWRAWSCQHLDFQNYKRPYFCCFKTLSLQYLFEIDAWIWVTVISEVGDIGFQL